MKEFLYRMVDLVARVHDRILTLNDGFPAVLSDKQLHFLVIGVLGMLLFFAVHPVFRFLIRRGHELAVSWVYVFTLILGLTFAIEIGQKVTNTGTMEFADIVSGVFGFLAMFAVFALLRLLVLSLLRLRRRGRDVGKENRTARS